MAVGILNKVFDRAGRSCVQMIAANKMRWNLMFGLPRAMLPVGRGTIGAIDGGRHSAGLGGDHAMNESGLNMIQV